MIHSPTLLYTKNEGDCEFTRYGNELYVIRCSGDLHELRVHGNISKLPALSSRFTFKVDEPDGDITYGTATFIEIKDIDVDHHSFVLVTKNLVLEN